MTPTIPGKREFELVARVLAERLHGREPSPTLRAALQGAGAIRWDDVVEQASVHYVLPAFAAALRDFDLLAALEPELQAFLKLVLTANVERNAELRDELTATVGTLNRIEVEPVLLKGAVRLIDGLYPDVGWRMMRDLDLLVPEAQLENAVAALRRVGYAPYRLEPPSGWRRHHHYPGLACPGRVAVIEIHTELFSSARRRRLLPGTEVLHHAHAVEFDGVRARVPCVDHQMAHLIGHGQISNRYLFSGGAQLRDLLEAALMDVRSPQRPSWQAVWARFAAAGYRRPLISFLLSLEGAGLRPMPTAAKLGPWMRLWRRSPGDGAQPAPISGLRLRAGLWSALLGELVLEPEMRRKALRRSAETIRQRWRRHPSPD